MGPVLKNSSAAIFCAEVLKVFRWSFRHLYPHLGGQMLCPVLRDVVLRWAARPHITGTSFFLFSVFFRWIGLGGEVAGTRRLCAWVRSNIVVVV